MGDFALSLQKFAEKAGDLADVAVKRIIAEIVTVIDDRSPVGDATYWKHPPPKGYVGGHFRSNWQLGVNEHLTRELPGHSYEGTVSVNLARIPAEAAGPIYWLSNNVPYARRIEDGWSHQHPAPQAVVGRTVIEFNSIVEREVAGMAK